MGTRSQSKSQNGQTTIVEYESEEKPSTITKSTNDSSSKVIIDNNDITTTSDKNELLNNILDQIEPFDGSNDAQQWFNQVNTKFTQLKLTFDERLRIMPYLFQGDIFLWYSLNEEKFTSYARLFKLFAHEYFKLNQPTFSNEKAEPTRENLPSPAPIVISEDQIEKTTTIIRPDTSINSTLAPTIAKALIDKFVKDPLKFAGGKDNVVTWIEEIEQ